MERQRNLQENANPNHKSASPGNKLALSQTKFNFKVEGEGNSNPYADHQYGFLQAKSRAGEQRKGSLDSATVSKHK